MVKLPMLWLIVVGNIKDVKTLHGMTDIQSFKEDNGSNKTCAYVNGLLL
jgi:hypothetical protein